MLNQLFRLSLNIGKLARITPIKHQVVAICFPFQNSNYSTRTSNDNISKSSGLNSIITNLRECVENNSRFSNNDLQSLLSILKSQKCNNGQVLEILKCCSFARTDQNQTDIVLSIWDELKNHNNDFQTKHYNYLMQHFINGGDLKRVQKLFDEMVNTKIEPDAFAYRCLVEAYYKAGEVDRAIEVLRLMVKANLCNNESSFNYLAQSHIICGNVNAACETIENLKKAGHKVNVDTSTELLNYYAKLGDSENIERTFGLFDQQDSNLLNHHVLNVMCELAANGHQNKIEKLLSYIKPTTELKTSLENAITQFVERNQSPIVPRILRLAGRDIKEMVRYLIEEMVRCSTPEQEFNETIESIESIFITIKNSINYFKPALEGSSEEIIEKLLKEMKLQSMQVSENNFDKLLELAAKNGSTKVLNVVQTMLIDYNIQPSILFIRDHILPALNAKENPSDAFANLKSIKLNPPIVVLAIILMSLKNADIQTAYDFAKKFQMHSGFKLIQQPLLSAFRTTGDVRGFVSFVRLLQDTFKGQKTLVSETLASAISNCQTDKQLISQLIKTFVDEGLTITPEQAMNIQNSLQFDGKTTEETEIANLLKKLSTEPFKLRPIEEQRATKSLMYKRTLDDMKNMLELKKINSDLPDAIKQLEYLQNIQDGSSEKIERLLATDRDYELLIELYTELSDLENAMRILKKVCAQNPSFKLYGIKVAKLVVLMIENGRDFSEVEELLRNHRPRVPVPRIYPFENLLKNLGASGDADLVEKLFDAMLKYGYVEATVNIAGPVVLAHIANGALAEAVDNYDYLANKFKFVPVTSVLFQELIKKNELDLLQYAYNILVKVRGRDQAPPHLAFALIECGQDHRAAKIFKIMNIKTLASQISDKCKEYPKYGKLDSAKTLLKATKGLKCDRHTIYQTILEICDNENNADEALKLWHEYFNDDEILPQQQFQTKLFHLLKANNIEIPSKLRGKQ